jgi:hypothetical protein
MLDAVVVRWLRLEASEEDGDCSFEVVGLSSGLSSASLFWLFDDDIILMIGWFDALYLQNGPIRGWISWS